VAKDDYEIGFGKPPAKTQFKKGTSGNPNGRPRGSMSISSILAKTGREIVPVTIGGKTRFMIKLEAACTQLTNQAASGDQKAIRDLLAAHRQFPESERLVEAAVFSNERDAATIKSLLKRIGNTDPDIESKSNPATASKEGK
jgi:hypothetical protein